VDIGPLTDWLWRWAGRARERRGSHAQTIGYPRAVQQGASSGEPQAPLERLDPAEEETRIGDGIAHLLTRRNWIHRRTEYVRFVDAATVHRQMGVDFTLPRTEVTEELYARRPGLVPLGTLHKRKLARFGMWDESGRRLPMLTTEQNGYYAAAAVVAMARGVGVLYGINEMPEPILGMLREVAKRPTAEANALWVFLNDDSDGAREKIKWLRRDSKLALLLDDFGPHATTARQLLDGPDAELPEDLDDRQLFVVQRRASAALKSLAEQLTNQFIVLTQLLDDKRTVLGRRLIKFDYEQPPRAYRPRLPPVRKTWRTFKSLGEVLSWWPRNVTLDAVPVGSASSHHIEIEAPEDIDILGASITAHDPRRPGDRPYVDEWTSTERQRVHLQVSGAPRAAVGPLWIQVRASRRGFLRAGLITAVFVAVFLEVGQRQLPDLKNNVEAASALLLAIPGLVTAYLLRPGEHLLASRMLAGPRLFLLVSGLCTFAAAGALAGGYSDHTRDCVWRLSGCVAIAMAGALGLSYVMPYLVPAARRMRGRAARWLKKPR
jgi:hypothetical protein